MLTVCHSLSSRFALIRDSYLLLKIVTVKTNPSGLTSNTMECGDGDLEKKRVNISFVSQHMIENYNDKLQTN